MLTRPRKRAPNWARPVATSLAKTGPEGQQLKALEIEGGAEPVALPLQVTRQVAGSIPPGIGSRYHGLFMRVDGNAAGRFGGSGGDLTGK